MLQKKTIVTSHQQVRQHSRDLQRRNALETASRLLSEQGSQALTVRAISEQLGCSTSVIYTMFGDKNGLAEALYLEGFERLAAAFAQLPVSTNPLEHLQNLGTAYRTNALEHPHFYALMFGQALPDYTPSIETIARVNLTFETMVDAVNRCIDAGLFTTLDARACAGVLWIVSHGAVSLELSKHFSPSEGQSLFAFACQSIIAGWLASHQNQNSSQYKLPKTAPQRRAIKHKS